MPNTKKRNKEMRFARNAFFTMQEFLSSGALAVIEQLNSAGFRAYAVGGCVRDMVMSICPHDYDIATNALPNEVQELFPDTVDTGSAYGTILIKSQGEPIEVTTFRKERDYSDGRHPSHVEFVDSLKNDVMRRDFTINGLAYHPKEGLIDLTEGMADIHHKIIRCIGDPDKRFEEDSLRILRAVRFACNLDFQIEMQTKRSMSEKRESILTTSAERIWEEIKKTLVCPNGHRLEEFVDILQVIFPEITPMIGFCQNNPYHHLSVWDHTMVAFAAIEPNLVLRLVMLFHDSGKPLTFKMGKDGLGHFAGHQEVSAQLAAFALERLKCDKATLDKVVKLIKYHDAQIEETDPSVKTWLNKLGKEDYFHLISIRMADNSAKNPDKVPELLAFTQRLKRRAEQIIQRGDCYQQSQLAINGDDLLATGMNSGIKIGKILNQLLELVINDQLTNDKNTLMQKAKELIDK